MKSDEGFVLMYLDQPPNAMVSSGSYFLYRFQHRLQLILLLHSNYLYGKKTTKE